MSVVFSSRSDLHAVCMNTREEQVQKPSVLEKGLENLAKVDVGK